MSLWVELHLYQLSNNQAGVWEGDLKFCIILCTGQLKWASAILCKGKGIPLNSHISINLHIFPKQFFSWISIFLMSYGTKGLENDCRCFTCVGLNCVFLSWIREGRDLTIYQKWLQDPFLILYSSSGSILFFFYSNSRVGPLQVNHFLLGFLLKLQANKQTNKWLYSHLTMKN